MDLTESILYSTVRLEVATKGGTSFGTAFFYSALDDGQQTVPILVTNKHVVAGGTEAAFLMHLESANGTPTGSSVQVKLALDSLVAHPDPDVDLCGIPVGTVVVQARNENRPVFFRTISKELFASASGDGAPRAVEDVLMVGYPNGLWDKANNRPIVRRGITATSPSVRFEGRPVFMIDAACFPGSSGSPVFLYERSAIRPKPDVLIGRRFSFLGVLFAGPLMSAAGKFEVVPIPTGGVNAHSTLMHLGLVVRADELLQIEDELRRRIGTSQLGAAADDRPQGGAHV